MNSTITRILVPTDFSACSDTAIHYAADLAAHFRASLELLHVVEDPFLSGAWTAEAFIAGADDLLEEVTQSAKVRLASVAAALAARGIAAEVTVFSGPPSAGIVDRARDGRFDLIIMGTHGRTGLSHVVLGSVAERVQRTAPCAVLTVKAGDAAKSHSPEDRTTAVA
jgi:nucleotide-binding universal stress UspA family protein